LTYLDWGSHIRNEISTRIEKFPYIVVVDIYGILNASTLDRSMYEVVPYDEEEQYVDVRFRADLAKKFELGPTVFLLRHTFSEELFSDLFA